MIAQYITGDLPEKDRTIVEEHIFECRDCFEKAQIFEKAAFLIQVEGPAAFVTQRSLSLSEKIKEIVHAGGMRNAIVKVYGKISLDQVVDAMNPSVVYKK